MASTINTKLSRHTKHDNQHTLTLTSKGRDNEVIECAVGMVCSSIWRLRFLIAQMFIGREVKVTNEKK